MRLILIALIAIGLPLEVMAQANLHDAAGTYDGLLDMVRNSANQWTGILRGYAINLFLSLAVISLVWTFAQLIVRGAEFGELVGELLKFFVITTFFYTMLIYSVDLASAVINSFRQAGAMAAGFGSGLRPGDMFGLGVELAKTLSFPTLNPALAFHSALAGIIILFCFAFIAAFMGITLIEAYVVINASVLLLGFGGSQWTREYAISMLRGALAIGVKLFVLTLLVGLMMAMARDWQRVYTHDDASTFTILGMAFVFAYACKTVPDMMASLISGVSPGGGGVLGGMAAAGMAGGVAAMAYLQSSGVMGGAGKALGSVADLLKGGGSGGTSGKPGGGAAFMNSMNGGSGGPSGMGGSPAGPGPRVGGGGGRVPPAPNAPSGSSSTQTPSSGNSQKGGGMSMSNAAHVATDAAVRTAGVAASIAVPGMEGAQSLSVGSPPTPPDLSEFDVKETPQNIIRPAGDAPMADIPADSPPIDTMESLQEALNKGKTQ